MIVLIVINQRIDNWEEKGELLENYFNKHKLFKKIYIISLLKSDNPSKSTLITLCGSKQFKFIKLKAKIFQLKIIKYLLPLRFYKILILNNLEQFNIDKPDIIKSVGDGFSGFIGSILANHYKVNLFISIHTFVSPKIFFLYMNLKEKINFLLERRFTKISHNSAKRIFVVYEKIKNNVSKNNIKKVNILYNNVLNNEKFQKKSFKIKNKLKLVYVGRLIKGKSPEIIIKSLDKFKNSNLTIYGDGPERNTLEKLSNKLELTSRVIFKGFQSNIDLIRELKNYDAFVCYDKFFEFPKAIMESLFVGLPLVANKDPLKSLKEFKNFKIIWVNSTEESYSNAVRNIINNKYDLKQISNYNLMKIKKLVSSSYDKNFFKRLIG